MTDLNTQINESLASDHAELGELLEEIFAAFEKGEIERIFQTLDLFWARLAMHVRAEHLHLFPAILKALEAGKQTKEINRMPPLKIVENTIAELQDDHNYFMREILRAVKQTRELRENKIKDASILLEVREAATNVKRRLEMHNEREETEVYEWADELLEAAERMDLNAKMKKELENLPPRFGKSGRA